MLHAYLDDLERRIDDRVEENLFRQWQNFADGRFSGDIFSPRRETTSKPGIAWPPYHVNSALEDVETMLVQQYGVCSDLLETNGCILNVRANYGTSIIPSLFGVELFIMEESLNTLPTNWPIAGGPDAIKALLDRGVPDFHQSLGGKVFQAGAGFVQVAKEYPNIGRHVHIFHPDLQSPMDLCEVLWGSDLFLDIMDMPELVKDFLELITETYICYLHEWDELVSAPTNGYAVHWAMLHKGHIMLRDDSAMNFSPEMYREFIMPYDRRLLEEFGGGAMHFCGKGDHYIADAVTLPGLSAINMSQPEFNDMEVIYRNTVDNDIRILGFNPQVAREAVAAGRSMHGNMHCSE